VYDLRDHSVHVLYTADVLFEAPNWSKDGKYLLANSKGALYRLNLQSDGTASPQKVSLDPAYVCNNDKAISPDGKLLAFSAKKPGSAGSQVFVAEQDGSHVRLLVPETPSYFHGWSPDVRWLAFVAKRGANYDIYRISVAGGPQERLTMDAGHNDGPDYSPDGRWIYINSDRSGSEQIWRLPSNVAGADGTRAERITNDGTQDWFPHPSPDGKWLVFLAFPKSVEGHNARLQVQLRMLPIDGSTVASKDSDVIQTIFGGQGTINVNSWSPDSTRIAFVSYEPLS
jgi:Tol biopolymer transport system component